MVLVGDLHTGSPASDCFIFAKWSPCHAIRTVPFVCFAHDVLPHNPAALAPFITIVNKHATNVLASALSGPTYTVKMKATFSSHFLQF